MRTRFKGVASLGGVASSKDHRLVQLPFQAAAFAIQHSQCQKSFESPLTENFRESTQLSGLVRSAILNPLTNSEAEDKRHSTAMKLLKANALHLFSLFLLADEEQQQEQVGSLLDVDALNALMVLTVSAPSLPFPDDDRNFLLGREGNLIVQTQYLTLINIALNSSILFFNLYIINLLLHLDN